MLGLLGGMGLEGNVAPFSIWLVDFSKENNSFNSLAKLETEIEKLVT